MLLHAASLRRNGKPPACEVCRKGKLRCDHANPHCGRCVRRKTTARCIYHPAPMTRYPRPVEYALPSPSSSSVPPSQLPPPPQRTESPKPFSHTPAEISQLPPVSSAIEWSRRPAGLFKRRGPYGTTSFSAVFAENEHRFGSDLVDLAEEEPEQRNKFGRGKNQFLCIKTLSMLPERSTCDRLLQAFECKMNTSLSSTMLHHLVAEFWKTFGAEMAAPREPKNLMVVLNALWDNDVESWHGHSFDYKNDAAWAGSKFRWEMLGIMYTFFGMAFMALDDRDPLFATLPEWENDRTKAAHRMMRCAETCSRQCEITDTMNDLVICMRFNNLHLESTISGDESYQILRHTGDVMASVLALGLHRLPPPNVVTAESEWQHRLFAAIFYAEHSQSSFNGIPPLLHMQYCNFWMPLDLGDEELAGSPEILAAAVSRLDANGWNTEGKLHAISGRRGVYHLLPVRQDLLEMALGVDQIISIERCDDLLRRLDEKLALLPNYFQWETPLCFPIQQQSNELYEKLIIRLEYLQTRYVILRLKRRQFPEIDGHPLFETAHSMMKAVLMFWTQRDMLIKYAKYFDYVLVSRGIPASGTLCLRALKHWRLPAGTDPNFPRSEVIRDLTMFIGFIEWLRPTDGNYALCRRLKKVIQRVLDHLLESPFGSSAPQEEVTDDFPEVPKVADPTMISLDGVECLDWLDSVDWTQESWLNPSDWSAGLTF